MPPRSSSRFEPNVTPRRQVLRWLGGTVAGAAMIANGCSKHLEPVWTGSAFPEFTLPDLAGTTHRKSDYDGRPLLVNFWATWCPPCREEMHDLVQMATVLAQRGLQFLAVSVDDDPLLVSEYLLHEKLECAVLLDAGHRWTDGALRVPGFPATYLVAADGRVSAAWLGPRAWTTPAMQAEVANLSRLK